MRIDAFRTAEDFKSDMDLWISRFREAEPIHKEQPVLIPGDPERLMEMERKEKGIPVLDVVREDLKSVADKFNIKF
jgi:LDH2 family malate/lactate/ureidoglycolate dehydrogenase